jgi:hypothetical protein
MPSLFTPPTQQVAVPGRDRFWRRTTDTVARTVLKVGDLQYRVVDDPSNEEVAASVLAYLGGRTYYVSDLEAADLQAAGFGAYLSTPPVSTTGGYGYGRYGVGLYGVGDTSTESSQALDPSRPYGSGIYGSGTYDGRG